MQSLQAFQQLMAFSCEHDDAHRKHIYENLLNAVASHRVGDRPGRFEPRQIKRRHGSYDWLTKPRPQAKLELLQGLKAK